MNNPLNFPISPGAYPIKLFASFMQKQQRQLLQALTEVTHKKVFVTTSIARVLDNELV
jgi:hypothetical protein